MQSQVKRRILFGLTTGGLLATGGAGFAHADASGAESGEAGTTTTTAGSPGILSGNTIQIPVDVPVNVCGDTVNVIGLFNPAAGNHCSNTGGAHASGGGQDTDHGTHQGAGGATATGGSAGSPGILSGNTVQAPVHVPVNVCGDSVNVVGIGNRAEGNHCHNGGGATGGSGGGATATGSSTGSSGVLSGNTVQLPVDVPVNACGDSVNVVGFGNGARDDSCANTPSTPVTTTTTPPPSTGIPGVPHNIVPETAGAIPATTTGTLAHTGTDALMLAPIGAALMGGGAFVYRKFKPGRSQ